MLEIYHQENYLVWDANCAADLEALQWTVPNPNTPGSQGYPVLIILPATTLLTVTSPRKITLQDGREVDAVKTIPDTTPLKDILFEAWKDRRILIFSIHLYDDEVKGQHRFAQYIKQFPKVVRDHMPKSMKFAIGLRELADLSSNRMLTFSGSGERESKRGLNYFSRVARHSRCALLLDMQDPDQIYSALVAQEDFILIKRLNKHHVPEKLNWLRYDIQLQIEHAKYKYRLKYLKVVNLDRISNNSFYAVWPDGEYSLEHNSEPKGFRHHASDDDALELAGVKIKFLSRSELPQDEIKLEEIRKKKEEEVLKERAIIEAIRLHEEEHFTWDEIAVKVGWLVAGKPSGAAIKMAARRYKERQQKGQES